MKIVSNTEISLSKWQEYVDNHALGTIFHAPYMFDIYAQTKGYRPFATFVVDDNDSIVAMLLGYVQTVYKINIGNMNKRIVLMNSPICNSKEAMDCILNQLKSIFKKKGLYAEIRNHYDLTDYAEVYSRHNFVYEEHCNILIDLCQNEDAILADMSSRRRKEVRHGAKENFEFKRVSEQDYDNFYQILSRIYDHAKIPLVDKSYFESVWKMDDRYKVILGLYENETLVGAVLLFTYKQTIYSVYGGSRSEYYNRRPNDYMFSKVFLWAKQNGYTIYDWLGAGNPNKPYGVRDWKKQFGGSTVNYGRYHLIASPFKYKLAKTAFKLLQKAKKRI
jgi:serine/alanine adding enzyme